MYNIRSIVSGESAVRLLVLLCLLFVSACSTSVERPAEDVNTPPGLPAGRGQAANSAVNNQPESAPDQSPLVIWAPPLLSINTPSRADAVLAAALAELDPSATGGSVSVIPKAERGAAGLLSYLEIAQKSAPSILPDIVLLHSSELAHAVAAGLISPLAPDEVDAFPEIAPGIQAAARVGEQSYGIPFILDVDMLVYHRGTIPTPPATFEDVLALGESLLFTGGAADELAPGLALTLYLSSGGGIDAEGFLTDAPIAERVFAFLESGRQEGLFPRRTLTLSNAHALWTFFANGDAPMVIVPATLYRSRQSEDREVGFARLPTVDGQGRGVITTWNFVLMTQDTERRQRALALLQAMFAPHIHGEWSREARQIPTQWLALDYWDREDPLTIFLADLLRGELTSAGGPASGKITRAMQQGQRAVLLDEMPVEQVLSNLPLRP